MKNGENRTWLNDLTEEDIAFLKRFLLASGSLKQVAKEYGISYPTVRLRLDRLIQKIELSDSREKRSPFDRLCQTLLIDGKIDEPTLRLLRDAHQAPQENES